MAKRICLPTLVIVAAGLGPGSAVAQIPAAVAAPGGKTIATFEGVGAQIYECKAGATASSPGRSASRSRRSSTTVRPLDGITAVQPGRT